MKRLANASEPPCRSPSVLARFAGSPAGCGKDGGLELCATSMAAHGKKGNMAELSDEQLWKVCQRKLGDCEPNGERPRLTASDSSVGCKCSPGSKREIACFRQLSLSRFSQYHCSLLPRW